MFTSFAGLRLLVIALLCVISASAQIPNPTGGSARGKKPYELNFTSATTASVTGTVHKQGLKPKYICYEHVSGTTYKEMDPKPTNSFDASNGNLSFSWTGAKTGFCAISTGEGGQQGLRGPAGQGVDPITGDLNIGDGTTPGSISLYEATANGNNYRRREAQASFAESLTVKEADSVPTVATVKGMTAPSSGVATEEYLTRTGNSTAVATFTGATTAGRCIHTAANGNLEITAQDCGTGGGGATATTYKTYVNNAMPANTSSQYLYIDAPGNYSTNPHARNATWKVAGTFSDASVLIQASSANVTSIGCEIWVNGADPGASVALTIPGVTAAGTILAGSGTVAVAAEDEVMWRCVNGDTNANLTIGSISVKFTPAP